MDKFMHALAVAKALYAWFAAQAAPWLLAVAFPSVLAALANKPKAAGFVSFLLKASRFIGVLTHNDEPGTLKAPLGLGTIYSGLKSALKGKAPAALALVLAGSVLVAGCAKFYAWETKHPTATKVLDCTKDVITQALPAVMADVFEALSGAQPDWGALGNLEESHGADLVGCAVQQVLANAQEAAAPDAGTSAATHGMASHVASNAHSYLKARGLE